MSQPLETSSHPAGRNNHIQISIWQNEQKKDAESFITYAVTVQRRYRDGDDWKSSQSFRPTDLLIASHGLQKTYGLINELKSKR